MRLFAWFATINAWFCLCKIRWNVNRAKQKNIQETSMRAKSTQIPCDRITNKLSYLNHLESKAENRIKDHALLQKRIFPPSLLPPPHRGETPLHRVAYYGRSKAAQRLVALRADVDAKNDYGPGRPETANATKTAGRSRSRTLGVDGGRSLKSAKV